MPTHTEPSLKALLRHHEWLRSLAHSLLKDPGAADDLAQDAWVAVLRNPPRDASVGRAWFRRVVLNGLRNRARETSRRDRRERAAAVAEAQPATHVLVERAEALRRVTGAVLELQEPFRSCVLRHYFDGLTPSEIAVHEGVPAATIRSRLTRARSKLRAVLAERSDDDGRAWLTALLFLPTRPHAAPVRGSGANALRSLRRFGPGAAAVALVTVAVVLLADPTSSTAAAEATAPPEPALTAESPARRPRRQTEREDAPVATADTTGLAGAESAVVPPSVRTALIQGRVEDANGRAIPGALVRVRLTLNDALPATIETSTSPDGSFSLPETHARLLRRADAVEIQASGHASLHILPAVLDRAGLPERLQLAPEVVLAGRLLDASGQPIGGATLRAEGRPETVYSDAGGRFDLRRLPPGTHTLVVGSPRHVTARVALPSVARGLFDVGDIRLTAGTLVRGRVICPLGIAHVELREPGTGHLLATTTTGGRGHFTFRNGPDGPFDLHVREAIAAPDAATGMTSVLRDVLPDRPLQIVLDDRASLRLWLADALTRLPIELHDVELSIRDSGGTEVLRRRWDQGRHSGVRVPLPPGTYRVELTALGRATTIVDDVVVPTARGADRLILLPRAPTTR